MDSASPHATSRAGADDSAPSSWAWVYAELLRIKDHRTAELQNQQARAATVLVANGLLFGFLASRLTSGGDYAVADRMEFVAAAVLALAVLVGLLVLWPRLPPSEGDAFLDPQWYLDHAATSDPELLNRACTELSHALHETDHVGTLRCRRTLLRCQLALIGLGSAMLAVSALTAATTHR